MRSYGQYCAIARSLDVIGDRWTMLIIREMWLRPCRYTDLRAGLPGIATNLLAERLRELVAEGLVSRTYEPPPIATAVYRLTERGATLVPVLRELLRWGTPLMAEQGDDAFRPHWLTGILACVFDNVGATAPLVFSVSVAGEGPPVVIRAGAEGVQVEGTAPTDLAVEATMSGSPEDLLAVFRGDRDLGSLTTSGSRSAQARMRALLSARRRPAHAAAVRS